MTNQNEEEQLLTCPYCESTQLTTNQQGYGFGKGLAGGIALGPAGLLAGGIGAKDIKVSCLNCTRTWKLENTQKIRKEQQKLQELDNKSVREKINIFLLYLMGIIVIIILLLGYIQVG